MCFLTATYHVYVCKYRLFKTTERERPRECDPRTEMRCDSNRCISLDQRCDNVFDCADETDEQGCGKRLHLHSFPKNPFLSFSLVFIIKIISSKYPNADETFINKIKHFIKSSSVPSANSNVLCPSFLPNSHENTLKLYCQAFELYTLVWFVCNRKKKSSAHLSSGNARVASAFRQAQDATGCVSAPMAQTRPDAVTI